MEHKPDLNKIQKIIKKYYEGLDEFGELKVKKLKIMARGWFSDIEYIELLVRKKGIIVVRPSENIPKLEINISVVLKVAKTKISQVDSQME